MMWDGFNKRKFPRLNLRCELILHKDPGSEVIRAQTENVGAGGVAVILERSLDRFSVIALRLELDANLPWIECKGKIVWSVPSREVGAKKQRYDTGIEFLGLDPGQQELIRRYIEARVEAGEKMA
jgi:hypothetical protein